MHSYEHAFVFALIISMNMLGWLFRYLSHACLTPCLCSNLDDKCSFACRLRHGYI